MTPEAAVPEKALDAAPQPDAALQPDRAEIVVGIPSGGNLLVEAEVAETVAAGLRKLFPSRSVALLFLADGERGVVKAFPALPVGSARAAAAPSPAAGGFLGPASALPTLLREAKRLDAALCALVAPEKHDEDVDWVRLLTSPILDEGYDFVCPSYVRGKLEGTLNTGIVYPLTRALFGKRLRQPLGGELAISRKLIDPLLDDEEWQTDPMHAGADVWLVTRVLTRGFRVCQSFIGRPPDSPPNKGSDLSDTLARVVGLLFHEIERHADVWQRISGSEPVPTFGENRIVDSEVHSETISRMVNAFGLGYQDLRDIWGMVLPPATLLALKRSTEKSAASFHLGGELWVRIVYDFALGYHMRLMDRAQMLRSMTPLYLGWVASLANEVRDLDGPAVEERIEKLCRSYEEAKPYLISRWRWPDRFNP